MGIRNLLCNLIQGSIVGTLTFIKRLLLGVTTVFFILYYPHNNLLPKYGLSTLKSKRFYDKIGI